MRRSQSIYQNIARDEGLEVGQPGDAQIALRSERDGGQDDVLIMDANGTNLYNMTDDLARD